MMTAIGTIDITRKAREVRASRIASGVNLWNLILAAICAAAALVIDSAPEWKVAISWQVDEHTHWGVSLNTVCMRLFVVAATCFVIAEATRRVQRSSS